MTLLKNPLQEKIDFLYVVAILLKYGRLRLKSERNSGDGDHRKLF